MTTENIKVLPVEQSSSNTPSHANTKVKLNSNLNLHHLKNEPIVENTASVYHKVRRTRNKSIGYDVSIARKIRTTK